jgi:hypothetical protein
MLSGVETDGTDPGIEVHRTTEHAAHLHLCGTHIRPTAACFYSHRLRRTSAVPQWSVLEEGPKMETPDQDRRRCHGCLPTARISARASRRRVRSRHNPVVRYTDTLAAALAGCFGSLCLFEIVKTDPDRLH